MQDTQELLGITRDIKKYKKRGKKTKNKKKPNDNNK